MFRKLLRRYGVARLSAGLTIISIVLSVLVTILITYFMNHAGPDLGGLTIAVLVPMVVAPIMTVQMLVLLQRLDQAEVRLQALSITDDLTQVYNRRHFIALAEAELLRVRRYGGIGAIAIIDLDDFKQVNDTQGHLAGDALLREFCRLCRQQLRAGDTLARYGGDEFIILLPGATLPAAREVVDRIRGLLVAPAAAGDGANGNTPPARRLSISAGMAGLDGDTPSLDHLVQSADEALYAAKRAGGDQVMEQAR